jgi:hypothetical protein
MRSNSFALFVMLALFSIESPANPGPSGITEFQLREAAICGKDFFDDIFKGDRAELACKLKKPNAEGCGHFMSLTFTQKASNKKGKCLSRIHPLDALAPESTSNVPIQTYSPQGKEIYYWLSAYSGCEALQQAKKLQRRRPKDIALQATISVLQIAWRPENFKCPDEARVAKPDAK